MRFTTNRVCVKNNTHIYVVRTSRNWMSTVCDLYFCLLPQCEVLCTFHSGFAIATKWCCDQDDRMVPGATFIKRTWDCAKEGMLLQTRSWHCVESGIHHERDANNSGWNLDLNNILFSYLHYILQYNFWIEFQSEKLKSLCWHLEQTQSNSMRTIAMIRIRKYHIKPRQGVSILCPTN